MRLGAATLLAAITLSASACQTHQGTAAYVGDTRITLDAVDDQVEALREDEVLGRYAMEHPSEARRGTAAAMVRVELFRQAAGDLPAQVTEKEIDEAADLLQTSSQVPLLPPRLAAEQVAYYMVIAEEVGNSNVAAVNKAINEFLTNAEKDHPVTLNPRFGKLDFTTGQLSEPVGEAVLDLPAAT